jgi:hypothetical protein
MVGTRTGLPSGGTVENKFRAVMVLKAMLIKVTMGSKEVSMLDQGFAMVATVVTLIAGDSDTFDGMSMDVEGSV